jgi:DNA-binding XRE family transcriptional regulator
VSKEEAMSALAQSNQTPDNAGVLMKAFSNACSELGVSKTQAAKIIGVNRSTLSRKEASGFAPDSKQGELSLHFIRLYRSLFAISGGDKSFMQHWFSTCNTALAGVPAEKVQSVLGLIQTNEYLDTMRGKI